MVVQSNEVLVIILGEEDNKPITPKRVDACEYRIGDVMVSPDPTVYKMKLNNADGSKDQK